MNTEAQRMRNARKRAKLRAKRRGDSNELHRVTLLYEVAAWDQVGHLGMLCQEHLGRTPVEERCGNTDTWGPFVNLPKFDQIIANNPCRLRYYLKDCYETREGVRLYAGRDVTTTLREWLEVYFELLNEAYHRIAKANSVHRTYIPRHYGQWKDQWNEEVKAADMRVRVELTVEDYYDHSKRSHVWQGTKAVGAADVDAVERMLDLLANPVTS